ncbi:MAG: amidase [Hyphomicrobiaceae bacterium]
MKTLADLTATDALEKMRASEISCSDLVEACISRIEEREDDVQAWEFFDAAYAREQAQSADQALAGGGSLAALHGIPVAIKDIIATADMPTQDGTPIHKGRQPEEDATCVRALRDAGAVIMGKSVTTELATLTPGKTRNPRNPEHTPGGSSSGSAAAVACGMVPLALATQTGGSVVRPASFCGIYGLKPTRGLISRTGVTLQSQTLDTVGVYGRSLDDLALITDVLSASDVRDDVSYPRFRPNLGEALKAEQFPTPRLAFCHTPAWSEADKEAQVAITKLATSLGETCIAARLPIELDDIIRVHSRVQSAENAHHFDPLLQRSGHLLSQGLRNRLEVGNAISAKDYLDAMGRREPMYQAFLNFMLDHDAVLCLSSPGPAPRGLASTGSPVFNGMWTFLGVPTVTLPLMEVGGLPVSAQLVGRRQDEGRLLRAAKWLVQRLG